MGLTGKPSLSFVTDLQSVVELNKPMGELAATLVKIERTSHGIFRADPFANMTVQAGRAAGATAGLLVNLEKIRTTLGQIGQLSLNAPSIQLPQMGNLGSAPVIAPSQGFPSSMTFSPSTGAPTNMWGVGFGLGDPGSTGYFGKSPRAVNTGWDRRWGSPKELPDPEVGREAGRRIGIATTLARQSGLARGGLTQDAYHASLDEINSARAFLKQVDFSAVPTMEKLMQLRLTTSELQLHKRWDTQQGTDYSKAFKSFNSNSREINNLLSQAERGSLTDRQQIRLDGLFNATSGIIQTRMNPYQAGDAQYTLERQRERFLAAGGVLRDSAEAYAYKFGAQLDKGIAQDQRTAISRNVNCLLGRADDFRVGFRDRAATPDDFTDGMRLRAELLAERQRLAGFRATDDYRGTGYDSRTIRPVINSLDSQIGKIDKLFKNTSNSADGDYIPSHERIASLAYKFENQLNAGISSDRRKGYITGVNELRSRVDDFLSGRPGGKIGVEDYGTAKQLREELQNRRKDLAGRRDSGNLGETGYDTNSIRGVIKGLDSEIGKLDRAMRQSNSTVNVLHGSFLRMAGAIVGIQSLKDIFMNATQQAIQFDRTLMQIQARATRLGDPQLRKAFVGSVTDATLNDALRTGMPIQQIAQVQETVHMAANGTFQQKAALGSTINNLSLTSDIPASEYMSIIAPMTKAGYSAGGIGDFLERSALFQSRYGVDKSRMNAYFTSVVSSINALGPLADIDTIDAAARQEAAGARDMVMGSKLNRIQTGFMSAKTRTRLAEILGRGGQRESVGDVSIDQILNSGNAVLSMDMISKAYKSGNISEKELLGVAQTMDVWSGNQTFSMLSKGLDSYRNEVRGDRAIIAAGGSDSASAAAIASSSISGSFDRMSNAIAALTTHGITPLGGALKILMNLMTLTTSAMSRLPYVTETVVAALGGLATALIARKGFDYLSDAASGIAKGGGMMGFLKNGIGMGGLVGAAVGIGVGVGGYFYNQAEERLAEANNRSDVMLKASMPDIQKRLNSGTDALGIIADMQAAEGRGESTTERRKELVALVQSQGASEADVLAIQQAQTAELYKQKAIKDILAGATETQASSSAVRKVAITAQKIMIDQRWNNEFDEKSIGNVDELISTVGRFGGSDREQSLAAAIASARGSVKADIVNKEGSNGAMRDMTPAEELLARQRGFKEWVRDNRNNMDWTNAFGSKIQEVGWMIGDKKLGGDQLNRLLEADNSDAFITGMRSIKSASAEKRKVTGQEALDFTWGATQAVTYGNVREESLVSELRKLPREFANELAAVLKGQFNEREGGLRKGWSTSGDKEWVAIRAEYLRQFPNKKGKGATEDEFLAWAYNGLNDEQLKNLEKVAPSKVADIRAQKLLNKEIPILADSGKKATPERGKISGGGGAVNFLSIMEKYFAGAERAAGSGDFKGMAQIGKEFNEMSERLLGEVVDPVTAIGKFEKLSLDSVDLDYKKQLNEFNKTKWNLNPTERAWQEKSLIVRKKQQEENIRGMGAMFRERFSPATKAKSSRKLIDEALKSGDDERMYESLSGAYDGIDMSQASDMELTNAKLIAHGKFLVQSREQLNKYRTMDVKQLETEFGTVFADPIAARRHIERLDTERRLEEFSNRSTVAHNVLSMYGQGFDTQAAGWKAWGSTAEMFGSDETKRRVQLQSLTGEQNALIQRLAKMDELGLQNAKERLDLETKIKTLDVERLKLTEEMQQASRLKVVGDDMTRQTLSTLFMGDPTNRNKSLADMWTKLPMQGVTDSLTRTLVGMDADNPIGQVARFMFDPGGEMTYKENISKLNESILALIDSNNALANAYLGTARTGQDRFNAMPSYGASTSIYGPTAFGPGFSPSDFSMSYNPKTGGFLTGAEMKAQGGENGWMFSTDLSKFGNLGFTADYSGSFGGMDYPLLSSGIPVGTTTAAREDQGEPTAAERIQRSIATRIAGGQAMTRSAIPGTIGMGLNAMSGANFWKPLKAGEKGTRGVKIGADGKTEMTGAGWGVAGVQMGMAAYSGYMAGKATGSQAAANYGAAGGALGGGASVAFSALGVSNPVGWVLLASAALAQIMAGTAAAAKAAEDKTKAYKKQEADFQRMITINEEQRKALGLAADRVLSERADIGNAFTGVAASSFLSGRFAQNAMQVNVQNLTVQASSPAELASQLAGTFTQQVGRGIS